MIRSTWKARIERAARLEKENPAVAGVLRFYRTIAEFQKSIGPGSQPNPQDLLNLLTLVEREGTPALGEAARNLQKDTALRRVVLEGAADDPMHTFFSGVLRQVYAERAAERANVPAGVRNTCPFCGERPVAAALRPEGDGSKRGLVCWLCFTEWEFRRLLCPNCGEEDHRKLPIYKADELPHLRAEACDTCRHYINAVDLTVNGLAIPEVDQLTALPLDVWLSEKNYVKLQAGILGL